MYSLGILTLCIYIYAPTAQPEFNEQYKKWLINGFLRKKCI